MILIQSKKDCCGCSACVQICPKNCIRWVEDSEGFSYPEADPESCIDCGLCEKICPCINATRPREPLQIYAAKNRNAQIRKESSSGGIFTLLAAKVIDEGGVVFGARFDSNWEVLHDYTETVDGLSSFRGSKYVQSYIGDTYKQAKLFLEQGRRVLYSGTPCQIKGLRLYLRKKYDNLMTVDFICHGVPSPGVWRQYLDETFRKPDRRKNCEEKTVLPSHKVMPVITSISFRDKQLGWKKISFVVRGMSAGKADKNSVLLSDIYLNNPFMQAFLSDLILRPSCYCCQAKGGRSGSDITIADFWGIQNVLPKFDDDKGVSAILINNKCAAEQLSNLECDLISASYDDIVHYNPSLEKSVKLPQKRNSFFADANPINEKVRKYCRKSLYAKILSFASRVLRF